MVTTLKMFNKSFFIEISILESNKISISITVPPENTHKSKLVGIAQSKIKFPKMRKRLSTLNYELPIMNEKELILNY